MPLSVLAGPLGEVHPGLLIAASIIAPVLLVPACMYLLTTISYHISLASVKADRKHTKPISPPTLPYSLPFLGSALDFLSLTPGKFWRSIQTILSAYPSLSILTVYMGGRKLHILYSPNAVTTLFKVRNVSRNSFNRDIVVKGMGMNAKDAKLVYGSGGKHGLDDKTADAFEHKQGELYTKYLLSQNAVNSLTAKFIEVFQRDLQKYCNDISTQHGNVDDKGWHSIQLVDWVKRKMFAASTEALFGTKIFDIVPDLARKYWDFDTGLLGRFYGLPRFLIPESYKATDELHKGMTEWVEAGNAQYNNNPPMDVGWEEWMGASVMRSRRLMYQDLGVSAAGMASFEMGFMFGLSSNAIPATTWMLCHLLSPSNAPFLAKIQEELLTTKRRNQEIDIPTLLTLPHLTSAFNETLRQYVDVLVTRELRADAVIDGHLLSAGDVVMAPQYLGHHDPAAWNHQPGLDGRDTAPPEDQWFGERFLKYDEKTGKASMSTRDTAGKYFPWGGGTQICPGRVFAKQEVLAGVAAFLLRFEVRFEGFLGRDRKGNVTELGREETSGFPVVKRQYSGNGVVAIEGDLKVTIREREW